MKKVFLFIFFSYWIFFFLIPLFQTPDEGTHFDFVYWLSVGIYPTVPQKNIPTFTPSTIQYSLFKQVDSFAQNIPNFYTIQKSNLQRRTQYTASEKKKFQPVALQAYNPPLYYFIASLFLNIARLFHASLLGQMYVVRLTSSLFYLLTIITSYKVFLKIFKKETSASMLTLFFGLNPLLLQSGVGISPDIALIFFSSFFLLFVLQHQENISQRKNIIFVACILGVATLCKITGIILIPGFILYLFVKRRKLFLKSSILFLFIILVILLPWLIANYIHYHTFLITSPVLGFVPAYTWSPTLISSAVASIFGFRHIFLHFSGFLGWNDIFPFSFIFIPYTILFVIFLFVGFYEYIKQNNSFGKMLLISSICLFLFFLAIDILRKVQSHQTWEIGGRDALFMLLPFAITITYGVALVLRKKIDTIAIYLGYFSIWYYYVIVIFILIPRFYV